MRTVNEIMENTCFTATVTKKVLNYLIDEGYGEYFCYECCGKTTDFAMSYHYKKLLPYSPICVVAGAKSQNGSKIYIVVTPDNSVCNKNVIELDTSSSEVFKNLHPNDPQSRLKLMVRILSKMNHYAMRTTIRNGIVGRLCNKNVTENNALHNDKVFDAKINYLKLNVDLIPDDKLIYDLYFPKSTEGNVFASNECRFNLQITYAAIMLQINPLKTVKEHLSYIHQPGRSRIEYAILSEWFHNGFGDKYVDKVELASSSNHDPVSIQRHSLKLYIRGYNVIKWKIGGRRYGRTRMVYFLLELKGE